MTLKPATAENFRKVMSCFATGVGIVTISHPIVGPVGVTINSFTSVSLDPLLVLFCLGKEGQTYPLFQEVQGKQGAWAITFLEAHQTELSNKFTRHSALNWQDIGEQVEGLPPLLPEGVGYLRGQFTERYAGGDHEIFLGHVLEASANTEKQPLIYHHSQYKTL